MEPLFVYGTLRDADVQQRVYERTIPGEPDVLPGYRKAQIWLDGAYYPIAIPDPDSEIDGLVLELTPEEMARGDAYEGSEYRRLRVTLRSGLEAWVYCE